MAAPSCKANAAACSACAHAPACRRQTYVCTDTETANTGSETASAKTASAKTEAADR